MIIISLKENRQITPHFSAKEFRCPCGKCGGGYIAQELVQKLEKLRETLGNRPIHVNSGYRCKAHNNAVGGKKESKHLTGQAADIAITGVSRETLHTQFGGVGIYPTFTHLDIRPQKTDW